MAWYRSRISDGTLIYRNEDLDPCRCKANFTQAALEDMRWLGLDWEEGPDVGGGHQPYHQSERTSLYSETLAHLQEKGHLYPCKRSRKELREYAQDRGLDATDPVFPEMWRPEVGTNHFKQGEEDCAWRFRVPYGRVIEFVDVNPDVGATSFVAGKDFGDFVVWRRDNVPAYELAVVVDDVAMQVSEVVRGADLLVSTARQLLLYEALGQMPPAFFHCPLLKDEEGRKLSKSLDSRSIEQHRTSGVEPQHWLEEFEATYHEILAGS